jgi:hypothetical protein
MIGSTENLQWRRSGQCGTSTCVEVAKDGEFFLVRDSKSPQTSPLRFTAEEWVTFVGGVRDGDFDFG